MRTKWKKIEGKNNEVLSTSWGWVSYNKDTSVGHGGDNALGLDTTKLLNMIGENVKDGEETALYIRSENIWYILEGDFRKEYEEAFPSRVKCMAVFNKHKVKHYSNYSTNKFS